MTEPGAAIMSIFYDPSSPKSVAKRKLPHWSQEGSLHFVTFRLADSMPAEMTSQLKSQKDAWHLRNTGPLNDEQRKEYYFLFSERVQGWLDDGHGRCLLADPERCNIVGDALKFFQSKRYDLDHWVIMPNHVHVLVAPIGEFTLANILHSWKSFTANRINRLCGTSGTLWQRESFDHIVRSEAQLARLQRYIIDNATRARGKSLLSTGMIGR
jgi:REP element-mobilizing transposase RayT